MNEQKAPTTDVKVYRLSGQTIQAIDEYEKNNFKKPTRLFERITAVLPHDGEVYFKFVIANELDRSLSIVYSHDGEEKVKWMPITEKDTLGYLLFLHAFATATVVSATRWALPFNVAYAFAQVIAGQIVPGEPDTYPTYVNQIKPEMMAEDGVQLDLYRGTVVGESRSDDFIQFQHVLVRSTAVLSDVSTDNNFREIYPIARCGKYIAFNQYLPHSARIMSPVNDECILPIRESYDLGWSSAILAIEDLGADRILHVLTGETSRGQAQPAE